MEELMKKQVWIVCGIFTSTDIVISALFNKRKEGEKWIIKHPIYKKGAPMYIIEATEYKK